MGPCKRQHGTSKDLRGRAWWQHSRLHDGTHPQRTARREDGSRAVRMLKGNDITHSAVNTTGSLGKDLEFARASGGQEGAALELS